MRWLLDGYNVIRRDPDLRDREAAGLAAGRRALLSRLAPVAERIPDELVVVFDGARVRGGGGAGRLQVVFSRPPESADDVLRRLAARWREGAVVVSSDRAVQTAARRAGAVAVDVDRFLAALTAGEGPEAGEPDEDDEPGPGPRRGPSRQPSRDERATRRALGRLRAMMRG